MRARRRPQSGVTVIQVAMAMPTLLFLLLAIVQFAFYEFSDQVAEAAAQAGLVAATVQGGSFPAGYTAAQQLVARQGNLLQQSSVSISQSGTTVTVKVSGQAMSVVPGLSLPVDKSDAGPVEPAP